MLDGQIDLVQHATSMGSTPDDMAAVRRCDRCDRWAIRGSDRCRAHIGNECYALLRAEQAATAERESRAFAFARISREVQRQREDAGLEPLSDERMREVCRPGVAVRHLDKQHPAPVRVKRKRRTNAEIAADLNRGLMLSRV